MRRDEGLTEFVPASCAASVAHDRAAQRVDAGDLDHAPLDDVFDACQGYAAAAENLVDSHATPAEVVEAWMGSPGHRSNLLDPDLTGVAVGCVSSAAGLLCSQVFIGPGN